MRTLKWKVVSEIDMSGLGFYVAAFDDFDIHDFVDHAGISIDEIKNCGLVIHSIQDVLRKLQPGDFLLIELEAAEEIAAQIKLANEVLAELIEEERSA